MGYASQSGRAVANPTNPRAFAVCDRCGFWWNHYRLQWQFDWAGNAPVNKRILVCPPCVDKMQEQLRAIILPADPVPISQPRTEPFFFDETTVRLTSSADEETRYGIPIPNDDGEVRITENDDLRVPQQTGEPPGGVNE